MQDIQFTSRFIQRLPQGLSQQAVIQRLAQPLVAEGCVVGDFAEHVLAREAHFPTGLPTEPVGVAIPHTDHKHVHHNAIALGILPEAIAFEDMGGERDPVAVRVIFLLALGESNKQINVLGWIMEMIQDGEFLQSLLTLSEEDIYHAISEKMLVRGEV